MSKENLQSIYTDLDIYFPYFTDAQKVKSIEVAQLPKNPSLCEDINKLSDSLFPVNPVTGNPDNMIDKLISPGVSEIEKERILSFMEKMPASKRNNLSDEDLIAMLPSRYNSTLTDLDKVRDFFEKEIYTELKDESQEESSEDNSTSTQTTEDNSASTQTT